MSVVPNSTAGRLRAERGSHIAVGGATGGEEGVWFPVCAVCLSVCAGLSVTCVCDWA